MRGGQDGGRGGQGRTRRGQGVGGRDVTDRSWAYIFLLWRPLHVCPRRSTNNININIDMDGLPGTGHWEALCSYLAIDIRAPLPPRCPPQQVGNNPTPSKGTSLLCDIGKICRGRHGVCRRARWALPCSAVQRCALPGVLGRPLIDVHSSDAWAGRPPPASTASDCPKSPGTLHLTARSLARIARQCVRRQPVVVCHRSRLA